MRAGISTPRPPVLSRGATLAFVGGVSVPGLAALLCLVLGLASLARGAWIPAKAALAQVLLERSWERALEEPAAGGAALAPWPWADTRPVARLELPERGVRLLVLAGASGGTLAFGPGHLAATPLPGAPGNSVVAGHRDTHFAVLEEVEPGEVILVEDRTGERHRYRVTSTAIVHETDTRALEPTPGPERVLTLVTCYPFDALRPGGPLRYVVRAVEVGSR